MSSLEDRTVVVTREEEGAGPLSTALRSAGAIPVRSPAVEIAPLHSPEERRRLLPLLDAFDWLVITSPRTVGLLAEAGVLAGPPPTHLRVAVAGTRTEAALHRHGWSAEQVPRDAGAEPLLRALLEDPRAGAAPGRVLFPASARAGTLLPDGLEAAGFQVERIDLYAPRPRRQDATWWAEREREGLDALTFTSPSAVEGLTLGLDDEGLLARLRDLPAGVQGPTTAAAAREAGWARIVEARPRSFQGLVDALAGWFSAHPTLPSELLRT